MAARGSTAETVVESVHGVVRGAPQRDLRLHMFELACALVRLDRLELASCVQVELDSMDGLS